MTNLIQKIDTKNISEKDLRKITEIEQDMWARNDGIGEYAKCNDCGKIHSKEDVFFDIEDRLKKETVAKIELALGIEGVSCIDCGSDDTYFIYDINSYIEEVRDRYSNSVDSFLSVFRNSDGEIVGFEDAYIDSFDSIYRREFENYYSSIGCDKIKLMIEEIISGELPDEILMCSSVGFSQKYSSFSNLYNLMKNFFANIHESRGGGVLGIYEAVVGGVPHSIYHTTGVDRLGINDSSLYGSVENTSSRHSSDIFVHNDVANSFTSTLSIPLKDFIKRNSKVMREVKGI